jgi:hypothetical protein
MGGWTPTARSTTSTACTSAIDHRPEVLPPHATSRCRARPPVAERIRPPATVPLPPMMADLPFENVDVLLEEPERLHTTDTGELKEDVN